MRWLLPVALVAASVMCLATAPRPQSPDVPLPWDMAHHYGGALEIRDALRAASGQDLVASLRAPDLYPPGHSVMLGVWLLVAGESATSARLFQMATLWACVGGLWLACRGARDRERAACFAGATAALLLTAPVAGLAATFMVEIPAVAAALWGLAAIDLAGRIRQDRSVWPYVAAAALGVAAPLLTKANIGLPIVAAGFATAGFHLIRRRTRAARVVACGCLIGITLWAAYLTWQHDGWTSLRAFARNRADATPHTPWTRLGWYATLHARAFTLGWPISAALLGLAIWGVVRRPGALAVAATTAIVAGIAPLALHPYLLDRNLVAPAALLSLPCGLGAAALLDMSILRRGSRRALVAGVLAAATIAVGVGTAGRAANWTRALLPDRLASLAPVSRYVAGALATTTSCRVLGTFNEFSPGWVHILWRRTHDGGGGELVFDHPYPLVSARTGLDARPDSAYVAQARAWVSSAPQERILTISVAAHSVWDGPDYQAWCAWKRNEIAAVAGCDRVCVDAEFALPDSSLRVQCLRPDLPAVVYVAGWGPAEPWGRWSLDRQVDLTLRRPAAAKCLTLRYAAFEGLAAGQPCSLYVGGELRDHWTTSGAAWSWQERSVPVADLAATQPFAARLTFGGVYPAFDGDRQLRALPFADVRFDPAAP